MAVNVLIADSFSIPHDIYWWNQDRYGSFVPLIAQPLIKILGISPMYAISICNYLLLTLGFIGFSKLFKQKSIQVLFAIIWFFPFQRFITFGFFPIGLSYSLLGFSLLFLLKLNLDKPLFKDQKNRAKVITIFFIWLAGVWISDLLFVTIATLGIAFFIHAHLQGNKLLKRQILSVFGLGYVGLFLCIKILKAFATFSVAAYGGLNSLSDIGEAISIIFISNYATLSFGTDFYVSLGAWAIFIFFLIGSALTIKKLKAIISFNNPITTFLLADFLGMFAVILLSHWVLLNGMGRWYFVAPYIAGTLFVLRMIDQSEKLAHPFIKSIFFSLSFLIAFSTVGRIYSEYGEYTATASKVKELNKLGKIGIIGDFWESYKLAFVNPENIIATPHENSDVRNPHLPFKVLTQPKIYVNGKEWLDEFPDTFQQFGVTLTKVGNPLSFKEALLCEYKADLTPNKDTLFNADNLMHREGIELENRAIQFQNKKKKKDHAIYGPYILLEKGAYRIDVYLSNVTVEKLKKELLFDVAYNSSSKKISKTFLNASVYDTERGCFSILFNAPEFLFNTEFRILDKQPIDYTLEKMILTKL